MTDQSQWFANPVATIAGPWAEALRERLAPLAGLSDTERSVIQAAGEAALRNSLHAKLSRVFLIELHAVRLSSGGGAKSGDSDDQIWSAYVEQASRPGYLDSLHDRYPALRRRLSAVADRSVDAVAGFAGHFAADREPVAGLAGVERLGELRAVAFGEGDTHRGGLTVARVETEHATVMYKPREAGIDIALAGLVAAAFTGFPDAPAPEERIRVPRVLDRDGHGWAEFVRHRYCASERELAAFYRGIGHWLGLLRLLGGTDMHAENMIAAGPSVVIVDAETLFDVPAGFPVSGRGEAVDVAAAAIRRTVLRTGLLPVRGGGYALGGVDISGVGALPGQQPRVPMPVIAGAGTGTARLQVDLVDVSPAGNQPSATPVLSRYWDRVLDGFREMTAHLRRLDEEQPGIRTLLQPFLGVQARRIRRPTQAYVDIARMLWHPASLHDEPAALARARDILRRNAAVLPGAPTDLATIDAEIADLLAGDVPLFAFRVDAETVAGTLADWRTADLPFEESIVQDALVGAYLNERSLPARFQVPAKDPHSRDQDRRRRALAARFVRQLTDGAVRGADGTVTWISPVFTPSGWSIRVLPADLYTGQGGVAVALGEYLAETRAGRADEVPGLAECLDGTVRVLRATEELTTTPSAGAFSGGASQVWTWLALHRVLGGDEHLERAVARAEALESAGLIDTDEDVDLLNGAAGAVVPLLALAAAAGDDHWLDLAAHVGRRLTDRAVRDPAGARWPTRLNPEGIGGFAHGATGVGWALARLALSPAGGPADRQRWRDLAEEAFAYQESLFDPDAGNWLDVRVGSEEDFLTSWCHGSAGIGLAMLDLFERTGDARRLDTARRAARACAAEGFGWSHTLCHGDIGLWEMLEAIRLTDPHWAGPDRAAIDGELLSGLEQRGPVGGLAREAFSPSLMSGLAGVVHGLLRMHRDSGLPSPLLLD